MVPLLTLVIFGSDDSEPACMCFLLDEGNQLFKAMYHLNLGSICCIQPDLSFMVDIGQSPNGLCSRKQHPYNCTWQMFFILF